jgi:hypothetical protein
MFIIIQDIVLYVRPFISHTIPSSHTTWIYSILPSLFFLLSLQNLHIMQFEGLVVPSYVLSSLQMTVLSWIASLV